MLRRLKERLTGIFVCRGKHSPTLLEDDETIYCERCGKVLGKVPLPKARVPIPPLVKARREGMTQRTAFKEIHKSLEERIREQILPEPQTKRRTIPHHHAPPAAQHHDAIAKHMKGKGHYAPWHRRTIKRSPKLKIEEDD